MSTMPAAEDRVRILAAEQQGPRVAIASLRLARNVRQET